MSQSVAQRDTSRRQTAEASARDRLRATLLTGTPEHESIPDVAGRAKQQPEYRPAQTMADATPFNENGGRPPKARSMREFQGKPTEVPDDDTRLARRKARREPQHVASTYPRSPLRKEPAATAQKRKAAVPSSEHLGGQDHPQSPLRKEPEHKRKAAASNLNDERLGRQGAHANHAQQTVTSRKRIYCGNNALAHELISGQAVVGKRSECFRKGVGGGLHAKMPPGGLEEFIKKWTAPYRKIVEQPLHYGDGPTPADKIPATLSQCLARGFAVGSIQKAKKEMRNAE